MDEHDYIIMAAKPRPEQIKFLYNAPAILYKGTLIVGDTHFGIESKLRRKGIYDEHFSFRLFERLKDLILQHNAKRVIFLGDVKEDITILDRKTEEILSKLSMICEVIIVKGNHDGGIGNNSSSLENCGNAKIAPAGGMVFEDLALIHGHSWPAEEIMTCKYLIAGHQHPLISITDAFGKKHTEPVWLIAKCEKKTLAKYYKKFNKNIRLILMPAFNPLVGSPINIDEKKQFGVIFNNKLFKVDDAIVFRLDGTCLGELKNINLRNPRRPYGKTKTRT